MKSWSGPTLNRFFTKKVTVHVVYDRLTGTIVGDTIYEDVVKRILTPKGFRLDERIADPADAKIQSGVEDAFHEVIKKLRYATTVDKALDNKSDT